ncbi:MAG: DUF429 domain-containing protein [Oxalobacteraceae bacterium]
MPAKRRIAARISPLLHGVDFTSAPRKAKPITLASGRLHDTLLVLESLQTFPDFDSYAEWLAQPGAWVGGFDFPFSLPRELAEQLGWPTEWPLLIRHYASLSRETIRETFKAVCDARPAGNKFLHRATDLVAQSSSSMKWVNPPVAYMLHAGAPLLLAAEVTIPLMHQGDPHRIALEAYPGMIARSITRESYKNDSKALQTPQRRAARLAIIKALEKGEHPRQIALDTGTFRRQLLDDGSGDMLDAVLCMLLAAWGWQRSEANYGLPPHDPLEGWIVGA